MNQITDIRRPIDLPSMIAEAQRTVSYRRTRLADHDIDRPVALRRLAQMEAILKLLIDLHGPTRDETRRAA
jgi:hypothetical protein